MAGDILAKEGTVQAVGTVAGALTAGSGVLVGTLDARAGGALPDLFNVIFSLSAAWATVTGIVGGTTVADLYLVPVIDATNAPDVDIATAGAAYIAFPYRFASPFVASKAPSAGTPMLFATLPGDLFPTLYNVYIINRSGQTMSAGAVLKALGAAARYT